MKTLSSKRVLITLGPTQEPLDPVRFLSNHSSGKMGFEIAQAFFNKGAKISVIAGPVDLPFPKKWTVYRVQTALDMAKRTRAQLNKADIFFATAAVADYRPHRPQKEKIKKKAQSLTIKLVKNPDILKEAGDRRSRKKKKPILVGFALETKGLKKNALQKFQEKRVDLLIGNDPKSFHGSRIKPFWVEKSGPFPSGLDLPRMTKKALARRLVGWAEKNWEK